ncbi:MAG: hypothetical protein ABL903_18405 [Methylococcales bacterium]
MSSNAQARKNTCLGIKKTERDRVVFIYPKHEPPGQYMYYVKALEANDQDSFTFDQIMEQGKELTPVPNTHPQIYQLPSKVTRLYILKTHTNLGIAERLAKVIPATSLSAKDIPELLAGLNRDPTDHTIDAPPDYDAPRPLKSSENLCEYPL